MNTTSPEAGFDPHFGQENTNTQNEYDTPAAPHSAEKQERRMLNGTELYMAALAVSLVIALRRVQEQQMFQDAFEEMQREHERSRLGAVDGSYFEAYAGPNRRANIFEDYKLRNFYDHDGLYGRPVSREEMYDRIRNTTVIGDEAYAGRRQSSDHTEGMTDYEKKYYNWQRSRASYSMPGDSFNFSANDYFESRDRANKANGAAEDINEGRYTPPAEAAPKITADNAPLPFDVAPLTKTESSEDKQARQQAQDILREGLKEHGWDGGVVTEEMRRAALKTSIKKVHTDKTGEGGDSVSGEAAKYITTEFDKLKREAAAKKPEDYDQAA